MCDLSLFLNIFYVKRFLYIPCSFDIYIYIYIFLGFCKVNPFSFVQCKGIACFQLTNCLRHAAKSSGCPCPVCLSELYHPRKE